MPFLFFPPDISPSSFFFLLLCPLFSPLFLPSPLFFLAHNVTSHTSQPSDSSYPPPPPPPPPPAPPQNPPGIPPPPPPEPPAAPQKLHPYVNLLPTPPLLCVFPPPASPDIPSPHDIAYVSPLRHAPLSRLPPPPIRGVSAPGPDLYRLLTRAPLSLPGTVADAQAPFTRSLLVSACPCLWQCYARPLRGALYLSTPPLPGLAPDAGPPPPARRATPLGGVSYYTPVFPDQTSPGAAGTHPRRFPPLLSSLPLPPASRTPPKTPRHKLILNQMSDSHVSLFRRAVFHGSRPLPLPPPPHPPPPPCPNP